MVLQNHSLHRNHHIFLKLQYRQIVMTLKKYSLNMSNIEIVYDGQEMVVSHFNSKFYLGSASDLGRKAAVVGYYISESPCSGEIRLVYTETGDEIRAVTNCQ